MAITHRVTRTYSLGSRSISASTSYVGDSEPSLTISIPDSSDGLAVDFSILLGNGLVSLVLLSDQAIEIYTDADNPGHTETISLVANVPYIWHTGWYSATKLATVDVVTLFVDNSSGSAALLQIEALTDVLA